MRNAYEKAQRKLMRHARVFRKGIKDNVMKAKDFAFPEEWVANAKKSRHVEALTSSLPIYSIISSVSNYFQVRLAK